MLDQVLQEFARVEANTRHDLAIFLILFSVIALDLFSIKSDEQRSKATAMWLSWGIPFVFIGFFILGPERDVRQKRTLMRTHNKRDSV